MKDWLMTRERGLQNVSLKVNRTLRSSASSLPNNIKLHKVIKTTEILT